MAAPRVISQGRHLLARGLTTQRATGAAFRIFNTSGPARQFSSSFCAREDIIQTPSTGTEVPLTSTQPTSAAENARSIAILRLDFKTAPADVEQLLRKAGVDVKKMQFRIDRFTFNSDSFAFVELESQEQVQKAIKALDGQKFERRSIGVRPVSEQFYWETGFKKDNRMFVYDKETPSQAIRGLVEGRRYRINVENPGWLATESEGKSHISKRRDILKKHLSPFGLEAIGAINPPWKQDRRTDSTFLTFVDFETEDGARRAVEALNDQAIEGRKVQLKPVDVLPKLVAQMGKVDKSLLAQLQQHGLLASQEASAKKIDS